MKVDVPDVTARTEVATSGLPAAAPTGLLPSARGPSVNTAKSFAVGGTGMQEGRSAYTAADNPGVGWMTHELTSATNLRVTRALTSTFLKHRD